MTKFILPLLFSATSLLTPQVYACFTLKDPKKNTFYSSRPFSNSGKKIEKRPTGKAEFPAPGEHIFIPLEEPSESDDNSKE